MHSSSFPGKYFSIKKKVLIAFLGVVLLVLLCYAVFFSCYTFNAAIERYNAQIAQVGNALSENLQYFLSSCVDSVRSIYYNESMIALLCDSSANFINSESADSQRLFSYMLSIYAAAPRALQIHLYAYNAQRSFLITTDNLQRYMNFLHGDTFTSQFPDRPASLSSLSVWVESTHPVHSYGHFTQSRANRSPGVFTINIPIFKLPSRASVIGLLSVDISTEYINDVCGFNETEDSQIFILDDQQNFVYASQSQLIGANAKDAPADLTDLLLSPQDDGEYSLRNGCLVRSWSIGSDYCSWTLYSVSTIDYVTHDMVISQIALIVTFILLVILMSVLLYLILLRYLNPLSRIATFIRINTSQSNYNLNNRLAPYLRYKENDEVSLLISSIDSMLKTISSSMVHQYQLALANEQLNLRSLQAQINPHFIYNTLQCIAGKSIEHGDVETYSCIASFGQLLQYAMEFDSGVTLEQEIQHIRRYIDLQSIRFGSAARFDVEADPAVLGVSVPRMFLQPLAENSIIHGHLCEKPGGRIVLRVGRRDNLLLVILEDNGVPVEEKTAQALMRKAEETFENYKQLQNPPVCGSDMTDLHRYSENLLDTSRKGHIGLMNVYMRILLFFSHDSRLSIGKNDLGGTTIRISIPVSSLSQKDQAAVSQTAKERRDSE